VNQDEYINYQDKITVMETRQKCQDQDEDYKYKTKTS